jgi:hypothetical protein
MHRRRDRHCLTGMIQTKEVAGEEEEENARAG